LCQTCSTSVITPFGERCWHCNQLSPGSRTCDKCRPGSPGHVWITTNYEAAAREVVKAYKFGHQRAAADSLAHLMAATFWQINPTPPADYLVVPIPTATSRIRERGFDHAHQLARSVARKLKMPSYNALGRLGQNRQIGAPRSVRLAQPADNYFVRQPKQIQNQSILLVDDVLTTGATLRATTKILRAAGAARVDALIFAKRL